MEIPVDDLLRESSEESFSEVVTWKDVSYQASHEGGRVS